jgi:hypothetical protein
MIIADCLQQIVGFHANTGSESRPGRNTEARIYDESNPYGVRRKFGMHEPRRTSLHGLDRR